MSCKKAVQRCRSINCVYSARCRSSTCLIGSEIHLWRANRRVFCWSAPTAVKDGLVLVRKRPLYQALDPLLPHVAPQVSFNENCRCWRHALFVLTEGFILFVVTWFRFVRARACFSRDHHPPLFWISGHIVSPTPHVFTRWSTSRLNSGHTSSSTSPCGSARSSFHYRQPYLGWRSQERLTKRTPAERLSAGLLPLQHASAPPQVCFHAHQGRIEESKRSFCRKSKGNNYSRTIKNLKQILDKFRTLPKLIAEWKEKQWQGIFQKPPVLTAAHQIPSLIGFLFSSKRQVWQKSGHRSKKWLRLLFIMSRVPTIKDVWMLRDLRADRIPDSVGWKAHLSARDRSSSRKRRYPSTHALIIWNCREVSTSSRDIRIHHLASHPEPWPPTLSGFLLLLLLVLLFF